jgi:hypothetical protein
MDSISIDIGRKSTKENLWIDACSVFDGKLWKEITIHEKISTRIFEEFTWRHHDRSISHPGCFVRRFNGIISIFNTER